MNQRQLYLAAYDISDPKRLQKALRIVRDYATGGQKSVFECFLTPAEKQWLLDAIMQVIDPAKDRFVLVRLDPRAKVQTLGIAVKPIDPSYFYIG